MKPSLEKIVSTLPLKELITTRDEIQDIITEKQEEEKTRLKEAFQGMAQESGLSIEEVLGIDITSVPTKENATKKDKRARPEPKYRNPTDENQTWSGRGRRPIWVQEYLANNDWQEGDDKDTMKAILEKIIINHN